MWFLNRGARLRFLARELLVARIARQQGRIEVSRISINTNIAALKAQRQLARGSQELESVYTRLSSGMRINNASDDAAGLAIATRLSSDRRLLTQANRNINDGISLLSVADGALEQLGSILSRLTELAAQSGSGPLNNRQRGALDKEAQALAHEYARVARSTNFNGQNLFDASMGTLAISAGVTGGVESLIRSGLGGGIGTGSFQTVTTIQQTTNTLGVTLADFNGDGILDVAAARVDLSVEVRLGIGDGFFGAARTYAAGVSTHDVEHADFNGDGIVDLYTADRGDGTVSVLLGNGDGTFKTRITTAIGADPFRVTSSDFNDDGVADLLAVDWGGNRLNVLLGNGDGTFNASATLTVTGAPFSALTADFNNDGIQDIATSGFGDDTVSVYFGNGDGTFGARQPYANGAAGADIAVGDINGDGKMDLISGGYSAPYFARILINQGNGTFSSSVTIATPGIDGMQLKDLNSDGKLDLVGASFIDGAIYVANGNGDGTFSAARSFSAGGAGTYSLKTGDLNGDGSIDVVSANNTGNSVSILLGERRDGVGALQEFSLKTQMDALQALGQLRRDSERLLIQRGTVGAFQSRLEVATRNVQSSGTVYAEAESRIRDADIAQESAELVRLQILQQVGSAILAQTNMQPSVVMSLISK